MSSNSVLFEVSKSASLTSINQTQSINSNLNGLGSRINDQQFEQDENKNRYVRYG